MSLYFRPLWTWLRDRRQQRVREPRRRAQRTQERVDAIEYASATPVAFPAQSAITDLYERVHLADAFAIRLPPNGSNDPEVLARFLFAHQPAWVAGLMRVRDAVVACFGLKTGRQLAALAADAQAGRVGIFRIYASSATEIVLGEDDRHLDFRVSVLYSGGPARGTCARMTVSTVVHCHNLPGRAYILAIAPFHRMVVKASLRRAARIGWPPAGRRR